MANIIEYEYTKNPPTKWGLLHDFTLGPGADTQDWNEKCQMCSATGPNISEGNKEVFLKHIKPWMKLIVEIGVCKNDYDQSSAKVFIENKADDCVYYGLDIEDRSGILPISDTVKFLKGDSREIAKNMTLMLEGKDYIDLLFIDGWHSVEMVMNDWGYAKYVRPETGVVIVHDTNFHPGPWCLVDSVDPALFKVKKFCETNDDFGITVLKRK